MKTMCTNIHFDVLASLVFNYVSFFQVLLLVLESVCTDLKVWFRCCFQVQAIAETEKPKVVLSNGADTPGYRKYYYSSSSPLTKENRSYKRKIIGKV